MMGVLNLSSEADLIYSERIYCLISLSFASFNWPWSFMYIWSRL